MARPCERPAADTLCFVAGFVSTAVGGRSRSAALSAEPLSD
ncbi:MAG: hypothetical protein ABR563_04440 [Pyrinomonadaceae bacterium]